MRDFHAEYFALGDKLATALAEIESRCEGHENRRARTTFRKRDYAFCTRCFNDAAYYALEAHRMARAAIRRDELDA